ncbi:Coproporphyrinogen III oxidase, partial [Mrakia frigida]|uniref:coproporphyrinogen III oxidase n=1 Tax=Mrakia frigida TaxID=29902 RepID=UPI003FCC1BEF
AYVKSLQETITSSIEKLEEEATPSSLFSTPPPPARFLHDSWIRPNNGGEGTSCVIKGGTVLEKGGVNISIIQGLLPPRAVAQMRADHAGLEHVDKTKSLPYAVVGLSIVLHPNNPLAPTCHFNIRYFEIYDDKDLTKPVASWFGGGSDLTPNYLFEEDAVHFHQTLKDACDKHGESYYPAFKSWCDKYFYIPHRKEARGVGGIFFDDLDSTSPIHTKSLRYSSGIGPTSSEILSFVKELGDAFVPSYLPILKKRHTMKFTEEQKRWQQLRRGRYVEFNLVNDRGTKFGLMTPGARIESVLMSLPETARWEYMFEVQKGSEEEKMMDVLRTPRNWV